VAKIVDRELEFEGQDVTEATIAEQRDARSAGGGGAPRGAAPRGRRRRWPTVLGILGLALGCGAWAYFGLIEHLPIAGAPRAAAPVPAELDAALSCDPGLPLEVTLQPERDVDGVRMVEGRFQVRRPGVTEAHEVRFEFYLAPGAEGPTPTFVVTPILAGPNEVAKLIAGDLTSHGYHALIVDRAMPADPARMEDWETALRDLIADRRRAIDWLETRPEVDAARIGAYGVSLGGMTTIMLKAMEPRVKIAVAVMAGGDLPSVIARSVERECRMVRDAWGLEEAPTPERLASFEEAARAVIRTDPVGLAAHIDPRDVLLFLTRRDTSVFSEGQRRLRAALGGPEAWSLPTGHYSAVVYLPVITSRARDFIASRFRADVN
jgi:dienelactone hydrolase